MKSTHTEKKKTRISSTKVLKDKVELIFKDSEEPNSIHKALMDKELLPVVDTYYLSLTMDELDRPSVKCYFPKFKRWTPLAQLVLRHYKKYKPYQTVFFKNGNPLDYRLENMYQRLLEPKK